MEHAIDTGVPVRSNPSGNPTAAKIGPGRPDGSGRRTVDKVLINDLKARGIIGVNAWEREHAQEIVINLVLFTDLHRPGKTDDIADCVNYQTVAETVLAHAEAAGRYTVEALAADIARIALGEPGVKSVCVRVEKPGAVEFSRSVGVEIERDRDAPEVTGR